ncbi:MAG: VCBS repeat-containing protein [Parasphingorhabdus sp.]|uniref:FG-GAP repeat domain-containing protein n=1 Tax=Parasphingorhabdus sp. TaxID=2709688 RepID=UPI0032979E55
MKKILYFAVMLAAMPSTNALASYGGSRVDQQRCSAGQARAIRDLAFMKRIASASPSYPAKLSQYVRERYEPRDIRLRNEPYKNSTRVVQTQKALEVARSSNFLEINCRKILAGGNGRAYDRIGGGFETDDRKKYFREEIQIDNEDLSDQFETSAAARTTYLRRMGTIHHEIYHNWSYDHKPHGNDDYNSSMNQVARHALQDSFSQKWIRPADAPDGSCSRLWRCRNQGYLLMRDSQDQNYLAFDPARRGFGLLGFNYTDGSLLLKNDLVLRDAALMGESVRFGYSAGVTPPSPVPNWQPARQDVVVATSEKNTLSSRLPSLNEFFVRTGNGYRVIKWSGRANAPNFKTRLQIPFDTVLNTRGGVSSGWRLRRNTEFLGYDQTGRNRVFVSNSENEIVVLRPLNDEVQFALRIASGTRLPLHNDRSRSVFIDGRLRFLGQANFTGRGSQDILIGTESKLVLLRQSGTGYTVLASTVEEAWSGPSRFDRDMQQKRPSMAGDFDGDGRDEILLFNDSGLRILKFDAADQTFRRIDQFGFGQTSGDWTFDNSYSAIKFGEYSNFNDREAVLFFGDGIMRLVFFRANGQDPSVFARFGTQVEPRTGIRGTLGRLRNRPSFAGRTAHNRRFWRYIPSIDEPVLVADMTGNGFSEIVMQRNSGSGSIAGLGILQLTGDRSFSMRDYRYTGCFETEACHEGLFGHWLLRKNDQPIGFLNDNETGNALLLMQNGPAS